MTYPRSDACRISLREALAADLAVATGRAGLKAGLGAFLFDPSFAAMARYRIACGLHQAGRKRLAKLAWRWLIRNTACHLALDAEVAPGLHLPHPTGIVIGTGARIAAGVTIYQHVTIGRNRRDGGYPVIGRGSTIYPNAVVVGGISVGEQAIIGAGAVVAGDVPPGAIMAGNPAKQVGWAVPQTAG